MRTFETKAFARWRRKERIADVTLCLASADVAAGRYEASLGGYIYKKRVARAGAGKSGGYRTILAFRSDSGGPVFFMYGFAKSERETLSAQAERLLKEGAALLTSLPETALQEAISDRDVLEVNCG